MKRALDKELDSKFGETLEYLIDRYNDDDDYGITDLCSNIVIDEENNNNMGAIYPEKYVYHTKINDKANFMHSVFDRFGPFNVYFYIGIDLKFDVIRLDIKYTEFTVNGDNNIEEYNITPFQYDTIIKIVTEFKKYCDYYKKRSIIHIASKVLNINKDIEAHIPFVDENYIDDKDKAKVDYYFYDGFIRKLIADKANYIKDMDSKQVEDIKIINMFSK